MGHESDITTADSRSRGRPKQRPDETERQRILASARDLFLDVGYGGTTMDGVAARCGVSKRTLYRLFPSKTDLFRAMVSDNRAAMLALPRAEDDGPIADSLAAIFRLDIGEDENRERLAFIRLAQTDADRFPEIAESIMHDGIEPALRLLSDWISGQQERGRFRPVAAEAAARMLMDMIFGVLVKRVPGDRLLTWENRLLHARRCIDIFLNGVVARSRGANALTG